MHRGNCSILDVGPFGEVGGDVPGYFSSGKDIR